MKRHAGKIDSEGQPRRTHGKAFKSEEVLRLESSWVEQYGKGPGQSRVSLWDGVRIIFSEKFKMDRTADSLRVKENTLVHEC